MTISDTEDMNAGQPGGVAPVKEGTGFPSLP